MEFMVTDPETTKAAVETASKISWEDFGTILGTLVVVGGFLLGIVYQIVNVVRSKRKEEKEEVEDDLKILQLENKQRELMETVSKLSHEYVNLKNEISIIKERDEGQKRDIERIEKNIDKIIDLLMKAIADEKL